MRNKLLGIVILILNTPVITGTLAFTVAPQRRQGSTTTAPTATTTTTAITSSTSSSSLHMVDGTASRREKQLTGQWEELQGNYILRPPMEQGAPRALLHFLGGAIVGAVPHVSYRYVLERLAEKGFLIVATPYNLSFDHLDTCDVIIQRFETIAPMLARQYGAVPVVGVGHSCGALLHLLITSLFPDTPRAANALISFNNKPVTEAVPFFDEFFAPVFTALATKNGTFPSSNEGLSLTLRMARAATEGTLPSDELLTEISTFLTPKAMASFAPASFAIPSAIRQALMAVITPSSQALTGAGILPLMNDVVDTLDQVPLLIDEVANGARDFVPPPDSVRGAARRAYRARRTLILGYNNDPLDESEEMEQLLKEAESVTRMKRPMIQIDVQRRSLDGNHATPLLAPPLDIALRAEDILGADTAKERLLYAQADATVTELVRWLSEGGV